MTITREGIPLTDEPVHRTGPVHGYMLWGQINGTRIDESGYPWWSQSIRFRFTCAMSYGKVRFLAPHLLAEGFCDGTCGSHSFATPELMLQTYTRAGRPRSGRDLIVGHPLAWDAIPNGLYGVVALGGKVIEHERGYRASDVTVVGLVHDVGGAILSTDDPELIRAEFTVRDFSYIDLWDEIHGVPLGRDIPSADRRRIIISELRRLTPHATG